MGRAHGVLTLLALLLVAPGCTRSRASRITGGEGVSPDQLVVRRGDFHGRFLLTGELQAVRSDDIVVPRTPSWQLQIRWMEKDGSFVKRGQKVLEFDNSSFTGQIEEKRLAFSEAENALAQERAQAAATEAEHRYELEQRKTDLKKAEIEAAVPAELRSGRDYQEKQLALHRARVEHEKAGDTLKSVRAAAREELAVRRIELDKAKREIRTAESAIGALTLAAPRDGILVVNEHPWEGRKFQLGDSAYVGLAVMSIPDLSAMQVEAHLMDVDDAKVAPGMATISTLDTYPELQFPGVVKEISPIAQELGTRSQRRAFRVLVTLENADPERMRPGMSVKVEIDRGATPAALLIPRAGLDLTRDPPRALLEDGGEVEVKLGACGALDCVLLEGLDEGTRLRSRA